MTAHFCVRFDSSNFRMALLAAYCVRRGFVAVEMR